MGVLGGTGCPSVSQPQGLAQAGSRAAVAGVWHCPRCPLAGSRVPRRVLPALPCPAHRETGGLLLLMPWEHLSRSPFPPTPVVSVLHRMAEGCLPEGHLGFSLKTNHPPEPSLCPAAGLLTPTLSHSLSSRRPEAFVENAAPKVASEEEA